MVNNIIKRQNNESNLLNLAAQRNLYSNAENLVKVEFIIGGLIIGALYFFLPIFSPVICSFLNFDYSIIKPFIGFITPLLGSIFVIIDLTFINPEINNIKERAAKIQEKFDCDVLSLPWNEIKINHPDNEEISYNSNKYKLKEPDLKSLKMWYDESIKELPLSEGRILCQRINCWWDVNLRENFIILLKIVGFSLLCLVILLTLFEILYVKELITGITTLIFGLFSFLYYYIFLLRQITDNNNSKNKLDRLKQQIEDIWHDILNSDSNLNLDVLSRQIQDELFDHRKTSPIVFDFFYFHKRNDQEISSAFSAKSMVEEYFPKK